MALRIASKINRQFVKNVCRSLSTKRDVPDLEVTSRADDGLGESVAAVAPQPQLPPSPVQYQVCQARSNRAASAAALAVASVPQRGSVQNESDVAKNTMAMQHLQPALLPEFFKPPVEINSSIYQEPVNEAEKQSSIKKARRFEESSTRLNLTLPLKVPKLANPFPEPVKVMESHTVSDREKAELMLAEQKMAARTAPPLPPQPPSSARHHHHHHQGIALAGGPRRFYSTSGSGKRRGDKDCKVVTENLNGKKKCLRRYRMPYCTPIHVGGCDKRPPSRLCKKKLAPYPSYSEFCVTSQYQKPSECRMCPWKLYDHPTFRPFKKRFHTGSGKSSRFGVTPYSKDKLKASIDNKQRSARKNAQSLTKKSLSEPGSSKPHKVMECLEDKGPCKRPSGQCEQIRPKDKQEKHQKGKQKEQSKEKPTKKSASIDASLGDQIGAWLHQVGRKKTPLIEAAEAQKALASYINANNLQKRRLGGVLLKEEEDSTCKKFPFKHMSFPLVKQRTPKPRKLKPGQCPDPPKHKLIQDCPPEPKDDKCGRARISAGAGGGSSGPVLPPAGAGGSGPGYLMSDKDDKKPPCKKFQFPKCKDAEEAEKEKADKCDYGPNPKSAYCPKDVGHELGYKRPKFIPKTQKEMDESRKEKSIDPTKKETAPFIPLPMMNPAFSQKAFPIFCHH